MTSDARYLATWPPEHRKVYDDWPVDVRLALLDEPNFGKFGFGADPKLLLKSFEWARSEKGKTYWKNVYDKLFPVDFSSLEVLAMASAKGPSTLTEWFKGTARVNPVTEWFTTTTGTHGLNPGDYLTVSTAGGTYTTTVNSAGEIPARPLDYAERALRAARLLIPVDPGPGVNVTDYI